MLIEDAARIIEAEAGVIKDFNGKKSFNGKLAVAQCICDNRFDVGAFTAPAPFYSRESLMAAEAAMLHGERRFQNAKILQFRSFKKYGRDDCKTEPDWQKLYDPNGVCPIPDDLVYLGKDGTGSMGHFYFGRYTEMRPFKLLVMAGHGRNVDGSWDPGACGNGYQEATLTRELTKLIKKAADAAGLPCDVAPDRNHYSFFKAGGKYDVTRYNYVLEIHFNANTNPDYSGDGIKRGSMCYIDKSETGHSVEDAILQKLYSIGSKQAWDGVVVTQRQENYKNGLMVQNAIRAQGVSHAVLETCFISDLDDIMWYQEHKTLIATKIVEGIIQGFRLNEIPSAITPNYDCVGKGIATAEAIEPMNVRREPHINGCYEGCVGTGERVEVLEKLSNGWLKIVWPGSNYGYAYTSNVNEAYYKMI